MILGILQCGHVPEEVKARDGDYTALYSAMFPGRGYDFKTFSVVDDIFPDGPDEADAWLVSGSRHGAYEAHGWIPPLEALIRRIRDAEKPLIGVCFGHQIIAQALGGTVVQYAGGWSVGRQSYQIGGADLALNAWHRDQVVTRPPGATHLGQSAFCENAALAYGDRILTVQPHPEFPSSVVEELITHRSTGVPQPLIDAARSNLSAPNDNRLIWDWFADVIEGRSAQQVPFAKTARA